MLADLSFLPLGDATLVGAGGSLLSGGQRKRIAIARCLYSKAEVTVMDCPLKSLDSEVASNIVNRGIIQILRKRKRTLVVATDSPWLLQHADSILNLTPSNQIIDCTSNEDQADGEG